MIGKSVDDNTNLVRGMEAGNCACDTRAVSVNWPIDTGTEEAAECGIQNALGHNEAQLEF